MEMLNELLVEELQDLLHAEGQLVKALPKMAKAAHAPKLRTAFEEHFVQTQEHVERLKRAFELLNEKPKAKVCKAMMGLVEEGAETISEGKGKEAAIADLALIVAAQKVEHYEISAYGSARAMAGQLGNQDVAKLLSQTESEEQKADELLTTIARPLLKGAAQSA
ncbi:MAG: ferritin-like domain-containing protein [Bryobacteraceae bacterium]